MVEQGLFDPFNVIEIYSDGGPKHFKLTGTMTFYAHMQL